MSKIVTESITAKSDLTGQVATQSRGFTLDGVTYELDLTDKEAGKFDDTLERYTRKASIVNVDPGVLREWAKTHGYDVGQRGRIGAPVLEAFAAARVPAEDAAVESVDSE